MPSGAGINESDEPDTTIDVASYDYGDDHAGSTEPEALSDDEFEGVEGEEQREVTLMSIVSSYDQRATCLCSHRSCRPCVRNQLRRPCGTGILKPWQHSDRKLSNS